MLHADPDIRFDPCASFLCERIAYVFSSNEVECGVATVGIIANPAAGKDIRRLIAHASVFDNNEKASIVRRVLLGLEAAGIHDVVMMSDYFGIGRQATDQLDLALRLTFLDMPLSFTQADSTLAAERMREQGVECIVTLGGDGTNRAVVKGCGAIPLVAISTGTNNVFPRMMEGTTAGLAAAVVARGVVDASLAIRPTPYLEVLRDGTWIDSALVDVAVSLERFVGARAVWDESTITQIILSRPAPGDIGLSSIGGHLPLDDQETGKGLALSLGGDAFSVLAPIAPGLLRRVGVASYQVLSPGDTVAIEHTPAILALDGEREITCHAGERFAVRFSEDGPRVVDVRAALRSAAARGFFVRHEERVDG
jgi:predicted polyphosphate/ATP-dependent NAD kinase